MTTDERTAKLNELAGGILEGRVTPEEFRARGGFLANAARGVVAVEGVADAQQQRRRMAAGQHHQHLTHGSDHVVLQADDAGAGAVEL